MADPAYSWMHISNVHSYTHCHCVGQQARCAWRREQAMHASMTIRQLPACSVLQAPYSQLRCMQHCVPCGQHAHETCGVALLSGIELLQPEPLQAWKGDKPEFKVSGSTLPSVTCKCIIHKPARASCTAMACRSRLCILPGDARGDDPPCLLHIVRAGDRSSLNVFLQSLQADKLLKWVT